MKKPKSYFIIGDIHGCYYTAKELIENHWDPKKEHLIQLGDLVNKGKHTFAVLEYFYQLKKKYPYITLLMGNNEYLFEQQYRDEMTLSVKQKFEYFNMDYMEVLDWMHQLPLCYKNGKIFASHAGVSVDTYTINEEDMALMFNRSQPRNIGKTQFIGHVVVDNPTYLKESDTWMLDTGAGYGNKLSAVKVSLDGEVKEIISLDVHPKDKAL